MSRTWGIFSSTTSSSVRIAAAMQGSAEFFAPLTRIVPSSGLPPRITNLSMTARWCSLPRSYPGNLYVAGVLQLKRCIFDCQTNIAVRLSQATHRLGFVYARLEHHQGDGHAAPGRLDGEHGLVTVDLAGTHQNADAALHQLGVLHVHIDHEVVVDITKPGHRAG